MPNRLPCWMCCISRITQTQFITRYKGQLIVFLNNFEQKSRVYKVDRFVQSNEKKGKEAAENLRKHKVSDTLLVQTNIPSNSNIVLALGLNHHLYNKQYVQNSHINSKIYPQINHIQKIRKQRNKWDETMHTLS